MPASRPPVLLCGPLLFGLSVDQAKENFAWRVVEERQGLTWLSATPKAKKEFLADCPDEFLIALDQATLFPRRVTIKESNRDRTDYDLVDLKINVPVDEESRNPCLDSWKVRDIPGWLARLLSL